MFRHDTSTIHDLAPPRAASGPTPGRSRRLPRLVALTLATVTLVSALAAPTGAATPGTLGVFTGHQGVPGTRAYEQWLGGEVDWVAGYFDRNSWESMKRQGGWLARRWRGGGYDMTFALAMLPREGGTIQQGAAGAFDHHFRDIAKVLVDNGQPDVVLRLGWEFNGRWYKWSALDDPQAFATYWRRIVTAMRSVPGADFRFDWSPSLGGSPVPEASYPGDAYVDIIGLSVYDRANADRYADPRARWEYYVERPSGLAWQRDFARAHGKPISFGEWGVHDRHAAGSNIDNPYFIQQMHDWINSNNVEYHIYFERNAGDGAHALIGGRFPAAASTYRQLFG